MPNYSNWPEMYLRVKYWLESKHVYLYWDSWVWPQTEFRFNSSLMWGASPYKQWAFGPVRYRKYQ